MFKKAIQVIMFLAISWGLLGLCFQLNQQMNYNQAADDISALNRFHAAGDDIKVPCQRLILNDSFLKVVSKQADKAKSICQSELFSLESRR